MPISIDTTRAAVAEAALDAGADVINDIWGVRPSDGPRPPRRRARRADRADAQPGRGALPERGRRGRRRPAARHRARAGRGRAAGSSSSSTRASASARRPSTTWPCCATSTLLDRSGRPILLGTSRKSTIGKVLDLPADQRLEGTLATTALGIAVGRRHRPCPRRRAQRSRRADGRRDRARRLARAALRRESRDDRPDLPARHGVRGPPRGVATRNEPSRR